MCTTTAYSQYIPLLRLPPLPPPLHLFLRVNPILPPLPQSIILLPGRLKRRQIEAIGERHVIVQLFEPVRERDRMSLCDLLEPLQVDDEHG